MTEQKDDIELVRGSGNVFADFDVADASLRQLRAILAAEVVKTLDKPKTHVAVPPFLRFTAQAAQMLGPRGRRWMNKKLGLDSVFLEFDTTQRQSYEQRAQSALGVVEGAKAEGEK